MKIGLMVATMLVAPSLVSVNASANDDVTAKLVDLKAKEPPIRAVQAAALRYFGLGDDQVDSMRTRASWKALMPGIEVWGGLLSSSTDDNILVTENDPVNPSVLRGVTGDAKDIHGKLGWDLSRLVFNAEELDVAALASGREGVIKEVTRLYYERRGLQMEMLLSPPADVRTQLGQELRIEELTSLVDAMCGGWFLEQLSAR